MPYDPIGRWEWEGGAAPPTVDPYPEDDFEVPPRQREEPAAVSGHGGGTPP